MASTVPHGARSGCERMATIVFKKMHLVGVLSRDLSGGGCLRQQVRERSQGFLLRPPQPDRSRDILSLELYRMKSNLNPRIVRLIVVMWLASLAISAQSGRSWMRGMVFDESETHGISGALVELMGDPDSPRLRSTKLTTNTDDKGNYSLREVPYGDYTFRVSATGFTTYEVKLYIASDALTELHVKLKKQK